MSNLGGWSPEKPVSEEVEKICIKVKSDIKEAGVPFEVFIPKSCRFQVVAGINYLVKVRVGEDLFVHAMIFQALNGDKLTVFGVQYPKTMTDPLVPF